MMNGSYNVSLNHNGAYGKVISSQLVYLFWEKKFLTRLLKKAFEEGRIGNFFDHRGAPHISYLLYADELLVFANSKKIFMKRLLKTFEVYESWLDQSINKEKLALYLLNKLTRFSRRKFL